MFRFLTAVIIALVFLSCASQDGKTNGHDDIPATSIDYLKTDKDSIVIPSFAIEVSLSKKANAKLDSVKESIIVAAWFSGKPKDTASREYKESGEMFIKSAQVVLDSNRIAKFEGIKFPKATYDSLADKDIWVLVNVYSGRKSSPDNLLDCGILTKRMSVIKEKKWVIEGKLIDEVDSLVR